MKTRHLLSIFSLIIAIVYAYLTNFSFQDKYEEVQTLMEYLSFSYDPNDYCPVATKLNPEDASVPEILQMILKDEDYRLKVVDRLSKAIQIPTEAFDEHKDISEDFYFQNFTKFHNYLEATFPLIHSKFQLKKINTYGLVFHLEGKITNLKPLMLLSHQDVVPVEPSTVNQWKYPPYSGHYDGEFIYGRGSIDCKGIMFMILEAIELLLSKGFDPSRGIILAFGFDEETSGTIGAAKINEYLLEKFGENSIYAIIDEGNAGIMPNKDLYMASIATSEKGYLDSLVTLQTGGGHSSMPPDHTSIGMMSQLISLLETEPFKPSLSLKNPFSGYLQCFASYSQNITEFLRYGMLNLETNKKANEKVVLNLSKNRSSKYMITTSQAIDVIHGGVKANALPESVAMLMNTRISLDSDVNETSQLILNKILRIAERFDLGVIDQFGVEIRPKTANGLFNYSMKNPSNNAPVSPWLNSSVWDHFTGTMRYLYEDVVYPEIFGNGKPPLIIAPGISTVNTDTRHYWSLTENIYRYIPSGILYGGAKAIIDLGIHSVNEHLRVDDELIGIAFYYTYLTNLDKYGAFDV